MIDAGGDVERVAIGGEQAPEIKRIAQLTEELAAVVERVDPARERALLAEIADEDVALNRPKPSVGRVTTQGALRTPREAKRRIKTPSVLKTSKPLCG